MLLHVQLVQRAHLNLLIVLAFAARVMLAIINLNLQLPRAINVLQDCILALWEVPHVQYVTLESTVQTAAPLTVQRVVPGCTQKLLDRVSAVFVLLVSSPN